MMHHLFKKIMVVVPLFCITLSLATALLAGPALAAGSAMGDIGSQLGAAAGSSGAGLGVPIDPRVTAVLIIRTILGFTTIVMICLNIYAGVMWMTAGGNEEQIEKATKTLRNTIIGLAIVLGAYMITIFVTSALRDAASGGMMMPGGILSWF